LVVVVVAHVVVEQDLKPLVLLLFLWLVLACADPQPLIAIVFGGSV